MTLLFINYSQKRRRMAIVHDTSSVIYQSGMAIHLEIIRIIITLVVSLLVRLIFGNRRRNAKWYA